MADDMLLWLDLETTGTDETKDSIIEVGCVLTTQGLEVVDHGRAWVVSPTDEALGRLLRNDVVREMHEGNGLLAQVLRGEGDPPHKVADAIYGYLDEFGAQPAVLAGSGVGHFDRRFLKRWMPLVDRALRHWCIDVGVVRRSYAMWTGTEPAYPDAPAKTHRALDDVWFHLEEARMWRRVFRDEDAKVLS